MGFGRGFGCGWGYGYGRGVGQGSGAFSGYSCVKFIFFGFNVIFWLLGCAILGIGIWLQVSKGTYTSLAPSYNLLSATILLIAAGVLVLIIGFFGCCGAIMESKCMLVTYFVLVVVIFVVEIVAGVLAFVYRRDVESFLYTELLTGIRQHYPRESEPDTEGLRATWAFLQTTLKCCGVYNYSDWFESTALPEHNYVPRECCITNVTNCNTQRRPDLWHQKGCLNEVKSFILHRLYIFGIVAIVLGVIQILGLMASLVLFCCLRMDKFIDEE